MDMLCLSCNEPWDAHFLRHDCDPMEFQFGSNCLIVKRCPCCPDDATLDTDSYNALEEVAMLLGDDLDGFAAEAEDYFSAI